LRIPDRPQFDAPPARPGLGPRRRHRVRLDRSIHAARVLRRLREAIVSGELPSGGRLIEARLAEEMGVSRGPVRSALHVLESEGLVESLPNGRTVVVGLSDEDLDDLLSVRFELESLAVRQGIESGASPRGIREAFMAMEREAGVTPHLDELDMEFHRALVEFSGSKSLLRSWNAMAPLLQTVITIGNAELHRADPGSDFRRILGYHRPLVAAIERGDVEQARDQLARQSFVVARSMFTQARRTVASRAHGGGQAGS
jgi:DNA-binding GntR family transcriptional regulator